MFEHFQKLVNKQEWVASFTAGKKVLDIGCAGAFANPKFQDNLKLIPYTLHSKISKNASSVIGIDISEAGIEILKKYFPKNEYLVFNAENFTIEKEAEKFDVIVLGDVIEHIINPGILLRACWHNLKQEGRIIITTANAFSIVSILKYLIGHETTHPDHVAFYSYKTLNCLLKSTEFTPIEWAFYPIEELGYKKSLNMLLSTAIEKAFCRINPGLPVGICCLAEK